MLKIVAASYSQAGSIVELEKQIAAKSTLAKTARESLVETKRQLKDLGQALKYAEQYKTNHVYHVRYQKSKDKDAYLRRHETELILHDGAENMLKRFDINPKNMISKSSVAITMHSIPKSSLYRKPINLLRKKPLTLTGNWITSTNILTVLRKLQLLTGQRRKIKIPSKFDI